MLVIKTTLILFCLLRGQVKSQTETLKGPIADVVGNLIDSSFPERIKETINGIFKPTNKDKPSTALDGNAGLSALAEAANLPRGTGLPLPELAEAYGYEVEEHEVVTDDGYILKIHRIPNEGKNVVLLVPGILFSGDAYLVNDNNSLAFILADKEYDVFMLSPRGTRYSLEHVDKGITEKEYFNFTITEIGTKDLPTTIDYVLNITGKEDLYYIGHSMGTTEALILCSKLPEYNKKIRLLNLLAPVASLGHIKNPVARILAPFKDVLKELVEAAGLYGLFYTPDPLAIALCNDLSPLQSACQLFLDSIGGSDPPKNNLTLTPLILTHYPKGSGLYTLIHLAQFIVTDEFREYDYGNEGNMRQYGQTQPPDFDLEKITAPVALYYGSGDTLAATEDVEELAGNLPNVERKYLMPDPLWTHMSFLYGTDTHEMFYYELIDFMKDF